MISTLNLACSVIYDFNIESSALHIFYKHFATITSIPLDWWNITIVPRVVSVLLNMPKKIVILRSKRIPNNSTLNEEHSATIEQI